MLYVYYISAMFLLLKHYLLKPMWDEYFNLNSKTESTMIVMVAYIYKAGQPLKNTARTCEFQAKHGITSYVYPELKNLYNILEVDFHPLKLYEMIKPCMEFIGQNDDLAQYVPALEDIIVTRVLKQVTTFESLEKIKWKKNKNNRFSICSMSSLPFYLQVGDFC